MRRFSIILWSSVFQEGFLNWRRCLSNIIQPKTKHWIKLKGWRITAEPVTMQWYWTHLGKPKRGCILQDFFKDNAVLFSLQLILYQIKCWDLWYVLCKCMMVGVSRFIKIQQKCSELVMQRHETESGTEETSSLRGGSKIQDLEINFLHNYPAHTHTHDTGKVLWGRGHHSPTSSTVLSSSLGEGLQHRFTSELSECVKLLTFHINIILLKLGNIYSLISTLLHGDKKKERRRRGHAHIYCQDYWINQCNIYSLVFSPLALAVNQVWIKDMPTVD